MNDLVDLLAEKLAVAGIPAGAALVAPPPAPMAPMPPEGPWLIVPTGSQCVVGAVGRGKFATYEALWTPQDAVDLTVRLAATPLPRRGSRLSDVELQAGLETENRVLTATAQRGGSDGPTCLQPGDLLDLIGVETSHHLYALGTSFPHRSQPPSDVGAAYRTFRVASVLPTQVRDGRVAPWFGQPGGGAMVVLDRPLRWYVDQGLLEATD